MNEALESKKRRNNLRAFMVKVDQAEAEPTRATEIASFMVVLLIWEVMVRFRKCVSEKKRR